jgi:hypothetical protein
MKRHWAQDWRLEVENERLKVEETIFNSQFSILNYL